MRVPARFEYEVARSVDDAVDLLNRYGSEARLLAGGHNLLLRMKTREVSPSVVDLRGLDDELLYEGGVSKIGALARTGTFSTRPSSGRLRSPGRRRGAGLRPACAKPRDRRRLPRNIQHPPSPEAAWCAG